MDRATRLSLAMDMLNEVIERDEDIPLKTFGMSMAPTIQGGEWVVVRRVNAGEVGMGDVVIYQAGNVFVAHRIIRRRERDGGVYFTAKGDAHLEAEGEIAVGEVVARVVALQKKGARIDMDHPRWRLANWLIARWSSWVDHLCRGRVDWRGDARAGGDRFFRRRFVGAVSFLNRLIIRLLMGKWVAPTEQELEGAGPFDKDSQVC